MQSRLTRAAAFIGVLVVGGLGLLWYLAYGFSTDRPRQIVVEGLHAPVNVRWHDHGIASIRGPRDDDAMAALGYVHGQRHAWTVVLWRQTATGRLGEWFGENLLAIDRLTRRLGLADLARATYEQLPPEQQALLDAYARGMNAALTRRSVQLQDEFVLLGLHPEPWLPWHTLALERLVAWLSIPPLDHPAMPEQLTHANHQLHEWLHLHGFSNSIAWVTRTSDGTRLVQRHVYGALALPFLQEIIWHRPDSTQLLVASVPGTLLFPAGKAPTHAWSVLLHSSTDLAYERTPTIPPTYERLADENGTEHLTTVLRTERGLWLNDAGDEPTSDSAWVLAWPGFQPGTDLSAWQTLLEGTPSSFHLLDGDGLRTERDGSWHVLGTPHVVHFFDGGIFVGNSAWSRYAAQRVETLVRAQDRGTPATRLDDAYSPYAADLAPDMLTSTAFPPDPPAVVQEVTTYLQNWDFTYSRASIGASIFDQWLTAYRARTDSLPAPETPDSLEAGQRLRYQTLQHAIRDLEARFGSDLSQWRWERVQPNRHLFPVWSPPENIDVRLDSSVSTPFAPLVLPGHGHPSTLAWNSSPIQEALPAPAAWESWSHSSGEPAWHVRRRELDITPILGRYLIPNSRPPPLRISSDLPSTYTTELRPPSP